MSPTQQQQRAQRQDEMIDWLLDAEIITEDDAPFLTYEDHRTLVDQHYVGGIEDFIDDGVTGFTVWAGDRDVIRA